MKVRESEFLNAVLLKKSLFWGEDVRLIAVYFRCLHT